MQIHINDNHGGVTPQSSKPSVTPNEQSVTPMKIDLECKICKADFGSSKDLEAHLRHEHYCDMCNFIAPHSYGLYSHKAQGHGPMQSEHSVTPSNVTAVTPVNVTPVTTSNVTHVTTNNVTPVTPINVTPVTTNKVTPVTPINVTPQYSKLSVTPIIVKLSDLGGSNMCEQCGEAFTNPTNLAIHLTEHTYQKPEEEKPKIKYNHTGTGGHSSKEPSNPDIIAKQDEITIDETYQGENTNDPDWVPPDDHDNDIKRPKSSIVNVQEQPILTLLGQPVKENVDESKRCRFCDQIFTSFQSLLKHQLVMHDVKHEFKCTQCSFTANLPKDLRIHRETIHGQNPTKSNLDDSRKRKSQMNFPGVIKKFKEEHKHYRCDCYFEAYTKQAISNHIREKHIPVIVNKFEKELKCSMCEFTANTIKALSNHHLEEHVKDVKMYKDRPILKDFTSSRIAYNINFR